jgi:hypothetical protein
MEGLHHEARAESDFERVDDHAEDGRTMRLRRP